MRKVEVIEIPEAGYLLNKLESSESRKQRAYLGRIIDAIHAALAKEKAA